MSSSPNHSTCCKWHRKTTRNWCFTLHRKVYKVYKVYKLRKHSRRDLTLESRRRRGDTEIDGSGKLVLPRTRHVGIKVDDLVRGEGLPVAVTGSGSVNVATRPARVTLGRVRGCVGQGIVEVADDKRVLVLVSLGMPWGRHSMVISQPRRVTRVKSGHGEPPYAEYEGAEVRHAVLVARGAVDLVAEIRGSHVRCLREDTHALRSCSFRARIFTSRDTRANTLDRWRWFKVRAARRRSRSSLDPGAFATAMAYFTFPVVRGHPVATGGFRSLADRPRDFFLLFHNTSLLNVPVILQQCLKAP